MALCRIHVNVCDVESIGRASLEAIAARSLTVLPPGVPEFEICCEEWIGTAGDPRKLADEIRAVLERDEVAPYPVERHYPESVAAYYATMLRDAS
jgi:hypothetical protein